MKKSALASACAVAALLMAGPALAGPAADKAKAHIDAIAKGDVGAIMAAYTATATLHWVGGPLDGTYAGADKLKELWGKFGKAQGALKATVTNLAESANPKGATVTANVVFAGQSTVKVRYVMFFRGDQLVDEIWQVDPNLAN
ncbi:MAG TPA: nuclear transport factor 2 family protein [Vineibacter sp.]|nr:nuclear transport factor 2 family protein [Vineibacter sp.]